MRTLTASVRLRRKLHHHGHSKKATVLVDMRPADQAIIVKVERDGERSIGLVLERGDVCVEVELTHPRELESDLHNALFWLEGRSTTNPFLAEK